MASKQHGYLESVSQWVLEQRRRLASQGEDFASYGVLTGDVFAQTRVLIARETFRKWELKLNSRGVSKEYEKVVALYCQKTGQPIPEWLNMDQQAAIAVSLQKMMQLADIEDVAAAVALGIHRLNEASGIHSPLPISHGSRKLFQLFSDQSIAQVSQKSRIPEDRLIEIFQGQEPEMQEYFMLGHAIGNKATVDEIMAFYGDSLPAESDRSTPAAAKSRRR